MALTFYLSGDFGKLVFCAYLAIGSTLLFSYARFFWDGSKILFVYVLFFGDDF